MKPRALLLLSLIIPGIVSLGCAANEQLSTFEMVRLRQATESARQQQEQAAHYVREIQSNNDELEEQLQKLTTITLSAEQHSQECERKGREYGVVLPEEVR